MRPRWALAAPAAHQAAAVQPGAPATRPEAPATRPPCWSRPRSAWPMRSRLLVRARAAPALGRTPSMQTSGTSLKGVPAAPRAHHTPPSPPHLCRQTPSQALARARAGRPARRARPNRPSPESCQASRRAGRRAAPTPRSAARLRTWARGRRSGRRLSRMQPRVRPRRRRHVRRRAQRAQRRTRVRCGRPRTRRARGWACSGGTRAARSRMRAGCCRRAAGRSCSLPASARSLFHTSASHALPAQSDRLTRFCRRAPARMSGRPMRSRRQSAGPRSGVLPRRWPRSAAPMRPRRTWPPRCRAPAAPRAPRAQSRLPRLCCQASRCAPRVILRVACPQGWGCGFEQLMSMSRCHRPCQAAHVHGLYDGRHACLL